MFGAGKTNYRESRRRILDALAMCIGLGVVGLVIDNFSQAQCPMVKNLYLVAVVLALPFLSVPICWWKKRSALLFCIVWIFILAPFIYVDPLDAVSQGKGCAEIEKG